MGFFLAFAEGTLLGIVLVAAMHFLNIWRSGMRMKKAVELAQLGRMTKMDDVTSICADSKAPVPTWVQFPEYERVKWLNSTLDELWPFVNKAASAVIKASVEPILADYCPVGITSLKFQKLTLGNIPPQIAGCKVFTEKDKPGQTIMEVDFKWGGDPSIILGIGTLAIAALPVQLKDLKVYALVRVVFQFIDNIPCIGAVSVSFRDKPKPKLEYTLKAIGGSLTAVPGLSNMIDSLVIDTINDMLVWPKRIVVPIAEGDFSHMELKITGILSVTIVRAKGLRNADALGKSDPFVSMFVRVKWPEKTKTIDNNLNPEWNETFEIWVEDWETQVLTLEVKDEGPVRSERLGIASIPLSEVTPETLLEKVVALQGSLDDSSSKGKALGELTLRLKYHAFTPEEQVANMAKEKDLIDKQKQASMMGGAGKMMGDAVGGAGKFVGSAVGSGANLVGSGAQLMGTGAKSAFKMVGGGVSSISSGVGQLSRRVTTNRSGSNVPEGSP